MKSTNGDNVKYIDGIYKSPRVSRDARNPIQVELPLESPRSVSVTWRTTKQIEQAQVKHDKFYAMATAALTGTSLKKRPFQRLRRTRSSDDQNTITIAEAFKNAELSEAQAPSQMRQMKDHQIERLAQAYKATIDSIAAKRETRRVNPKHFVSPQSTSVNKSNLFTLQTAIILMLSAALCATLYSYFQYKSKMNNALQAQQVQSDAEWQQLQSSWQCINNKWEQLQSQSTASPEAKNEITC